MPSPRSVHAVLTVAVFAFGCEGAQRAPHAAPPTPTVAPTDPCAAPLAEAGALEASGRLIEAWERLGLAEGDGCRAEAARVVAARAALTQALGDDDSKSDSVERAEALAGEAARAAAAGQKAEASRGYQRARRMLERVTGAKAVRLPTAGAEIVRVSSHEAWIALRVEQEQVLGRFALREAPLRFEPSLAIDGSSLASLSFGKRRPELVLVSQSGGNVLLEGRGAPPHKFEALGSYLLPDEERVLAVESSALALRAVSDGHVIQRLPLASAAGPGSVSPDGRFYQSTGVLVDLQRMEALVDEAGDEVRGSLVSPGFKVMAVVRAEPLEATFVDALYLWRLDRPKRKPVKVSTVGSWMSGTPLLDFSRDETRVRVGYVEMAAMGVRPHAVEGSVYDVATGRQATATASAFTPIDHYAVHAARAAEVARALSPGFKAVPEQFSVSMDRFWPPSATSADGSTIALVEARRDAEGGWHDAQLLVFDRATHARRARVDLKSPELHVVSVAISPHGRWVQVCSEDCVLIDARSGEVAAPSLGEGTSFSDDDRFEVARESLLEIASRATVTIPPEVCRVGSVLTFAEVCPAAAAPQKP